MVLWLIGMDCTFSNNHFSADLIYAIIYFGKMNQNQPIRKHRMWCAVCEKMANFHYYDVPCCEGCNLFFRRAIVGQKLWSCAKRDGNCDITVNRNGDKEENKKEDWEQKLLEDPHRWHAVDVGWTNDWRYINLCHNSQLTEYLNKLKKRKSYLLGSAAATDLLITARWQDNHEIRRLSHLIKNHQRIWHVFEHLPDNYLDNYQSLDDLLIGAADNILGHVDSFKAPLDPMEPAQLVSEMEGMDTSLGHPWLIKLFSVDRLLAISMIMAMPFFDKLSLKDRAILVRYVAVPSIAFFNSFYSVQLKASTWVKHNGFTAISLFKQYTGDDRLATFADRECTGSMIPFLRTPIGELDEFALLLAILHSHFAVHGLSHGAKALLYSESVRYSAILLRLLQCRLGPAAGAIRFAEYLHLVESAFHSGRAHALFCVCIQAFDLLRDVPLVPFPKCLTEII